MLYQKDFKESYMAREGFGGRITVATSRANAAEKYVIKLQRRKQSLNEYVAQELIEALGYKAIPVAWYQDSRGDVYGALKFINGLKPVGLDNSSGLTAEQKKKMLFHLSLSFILGNADGGEVFLVNAAGESVATAEMDICSLDYGEALCGKSIFAATFEEDVAGRLKIITTVSQKHMAITADFGKSDVENACLSSVWRLAGLDMSKMASTLSDIERYFSRQQGERYREYLEGLKEGCAGVVKHTP